MHTVVPQDTRTRLTEALDDLNVPVTDHPDLTAWLCGLRDVPAHMLPLTDLQHALERLANAADPDRLLTEWQASRTRPEPTAAEWLQL